MNNEERRIARWHGVVAGWAMLMLVAGCGERRIEIKNGPVPIVHETVGAGNPVVRGDFVTIDYVITTEEGDELQRFDNYRFQAGMGTVVAGMDEAVLGMRKGGRRVVEVPPQKHWGRKGYGEGRGAIPPSTRLRFDVRLIDVGDAPY